MRTSRKIDDLTDKLRGLIRSGADGYTGALPGRRELATRHGISVAGVQIALKQLEAEGLVENFPRRGARVRPGAAVAAPAAGPDVVRVAVFEDFPHQTAFWLRCFAAFEEANPGCQVRARFYRAEAEDSVGDARVGLRAGRLPTPRPAVPLTEILGTARVAEIRAAALPQLTDYDWNLSLPYQVQFSAFVFAGDATAAARLQAAGAAGPEPWAREVAAVLGPRGLAPLPLDWLFNACGLSDLIDAAPDRLAGAAELRRVCAVLAACAQTSALNPFIVSPEELAAPPIPAKVRGAVVHCHRWQPYGIGGGLCRALPLPMVPGTSLRVFVPGAALYGDEPVTPGERAFFEYLASSAFHDAQMRGWMGMSPFLPSLRAAVDIPGMAPLAAAAAGMPMRSQPVFLQPAVEQALRGPVVRPLLAGQLDVEAAMDAAAPCLADFAAAMATGV